MLVYKGQRLIGGLQLANNNHMHASDIWIELARGKVKALSYRLWRMHNSTSVQYDIIQCKQFDTVLPRCTVWREFVKRKIELKKCEQNSQIIGITLDAETPQKQGQTLEQQAT